MAYIARPDDVQCSNTDTLPDGYSLFGNTTDTSITVTGLQAGTCYVFGVRAYVPGEKGPGQWTLSVQQTHGRSNNDGKRLTD